MTVDLVLALDRPPDLHPAGTPGVSGHIAVAAILLLTYRSDGLALGLGSRAVSAAVLAALGLALAAPSPSPEQAPNRSPQRTRWPSVLED